MATAWWRRRLQSEPDVYTAVMTFQCAWRGERRMFAQIQFRGPVRYQVRSAALAAQAVTAVSARRLFKGPQRPSWSWWMEVATHLLNRQLKAAFVMNDPREARSFLDSTVVRSRSLAEVTITSAGQQSFRGSWFVSNDAPPKVTVLYLHGGGYSFYPKSYESFIALFTLAVKSKTLALDYRLAPEHRFPSQLEDATNAYRWLLDTGVAADQLVVAGDSAGGNLTLALLLQARELQLPLPALAVALSPATNFAIQPKGEGCDWIEPMMLEHWRNWFCDPADYRNPLLSPVLADLQGLPPIFIQAGRCELLLDSIQAFADVAGSQGADVTFEAWQDMNHDFQLFGPDAPQSSEALRRIGEVIGDWVRPQKAAAELGTRERQ